MPRYPKPQTWSEEVDEAFEREVDAETKLVRGLNRTNEIRERHRLVVRDVDP